MPPEQIEVIIHPQSVIHSMVEYVDGSVLAQLGFRYANTDCNMLWLGPVFEHQYQSLDLIQLSRFDFESPDHQRFPALSLAIAIS